MPETQDSESEPTREANISLDELSQAFAQVMGTAPSGAALDSTASDDAQPPEEPAPQATESAEQQDSSAETEPPDEAYEPVDEEYRAEITPQSILEAMLFVGNRDNEPLSATRAAELMRDVEPEEIVALVDTLNREYEANGCPQTIVHEGSGYRMTLRGAFHKLRNRFYGRVREARLSQATIDVLAVIAYQQPLTAEDVGKLRGKPSNHLLSQLVRRGLLRIERAEGERKITQYRTTDRFLTLFRLESLDDLPQSEELDR
ncbi:MAG TPA: SMC-Scp complex subunit ScpB [Thermoguttaceae bacterium]|nr:SMC-Scp complex subunit ScpB [Thermoguttaceae bacterium]